MNHRKAETSLGVVARMEEDLQLLKDWCEFESK
jgi:hypothetical protein